MLGEFQFILNWVWGVIDSVWTEVLLAVIAVTVLWFLLWRW